jgi:hypothetical protein
MKDKTHKRPIPRQYFNYFFVASISIQFQDRARPGAKWRSEEDKLEGGSSMAKTSSFELRASSFKIQLQRGGITHATK